MNEGVKRVPVPLVLALAFGCHASQSAGPSTPVPPPTTVAAVAIASPSPAVGAPSAPPPAAPEDADPPADCIHDSYNGVDSVSLAIYFLECGGTRIPGSRDIIDVPLGCRIHFNATPRDGMGAPTCSRTWPEWQVGPEDVVTGGGRYTFTPAYATLQTGTMGARCIVDGVRSDWIILHIVDR